MPENILRKRVRSKLRTGEPGATCMSAAELLAVLLQHGPCSATALELSERLLSRFVVGIADEISKFVQALFDLGERSGWRS